MPHDSDLREVLFPPKDEPLRQDVRLLGDLVGAVIREQGGEKLFDCVERARHAAIRRREGVAGASKELEGVLAGLPAEAAAEIIRAFSTYFQVVNLAERVHRIRRGREHMRTEGASQEGSLADTVQRLRDAGIPPERIRAVFSASRVEPVFTAHPTESTRRVVLDKQERIARELMERLDPTRTPHDERTSWAVIREAVTAAWQTEEHPSTRPTVADEREHVLYYVSGVLYRVAAALHEHLEEALAQAGVEPLGEAPPLLRPGSWVGGDMDGNPNVDADTLRSTLARHRSLALGAYREEVRILARQLTQSSSRVGWSEAVTRRTKDYAGRFPSVADAVPARHADMGYRVFLELVRARIDATLADTEQAYGGPDELAADIAVVAESLEANRGAHAGLFGVRRLLRRVRTFGFHMAVLDVRQDARELREVVAEILGEPDWPEREPGERTARLRELLTSDQDFSSPRTRTSTPPRSASGRRWTSSPRSGRDMAATAPTPSAPTSSPWPRTWTISSPSCGSLRWVGSAPPTVSRWTSPPSSRPFRIWRRPKGCSTGFSPIPGWVPTWPGGGIVRWSWWGTRTRTRTGGSRRRVGRSTVRSRAWRGPPRGTA
jgi:phosphoenolpyruvate carboxylase